MYRCGGGQLQVGYSVINHPWARLGNGVTHCAMRQKIWLKLIQSILVNWHIFQRWKGLSHAGKGGVQNTLHEIRPLIT